MKKLIQLMSILLIMAMMFVGCTKEDEDASANDNEQTSSQETDGDEADTSEMVEDETTSDESGYSYDGELLLTGLESDFTVTYNDIFAMAPVTSLVHHISSSGEESEDEVTGVLLDTVLEEFGLTQRDFSAIRMIAGDGYEVTVPAEVIAEHDIILAYEFNGEPLEEKKMPLRIAIDGVRSMYFVSNLVEISFSDEAASEETVNDVLLLETAVAGLTSENYMYYDNNDQAVKVSDLLTTYGVKTDEDVFFEAADGYEKAESMSVFENGFIKITGEDAPMFLSPDIPKGMYVKYIMSLTAGSTTFTSVESAMTALGEITIDGQVGVSLEALLNKMGLKASAYNLVAADGYSVEIDGASVKDGLLYVDEERMTVSVKFNGDYPKSYQLKDLLTIGIAQAATTSSDNDATTGLEPWAITFEGLIDGSFEMDSDRASRKLNLVELHTERMKNDEKKAEDWTGYLVLDMLEFLHVEQFSSLVFVANDGFEVEIMASDIDQETIIAVTKDGEPIDSEFKVQLVQNTDFSSTWVKGVAKIIVKDATAVEGEVEPDTSLELEAWTITFDGLSDGSFDLSSEKAAQKMTLVELSTEREKDDQKYPETWTGYRIEEILGWLKVESYSSLVIVASDGYEVELMGTQIDNDTIIAITKNGEPIDSEFKVQLVQNTQFATTWVKGVAKIIVKQ